MRIRLLHSSVAVFIVGFVSLFGWAAKVNDTFTCPPTMVFQPDDKYPIETNRLKAGPKRMARVAKNVIFFVDAAKLRGIAPVEAVTQQFIGRAYDEKRIALADAELIAGLMTTIGDFNYTQHLQPVKDRNVTLAMVELFNRYGTDFRSHLNKLYKTTST